VYCIAHAITVPFTIGSRLIVLQSFASKSKSLVQTLQVSESEMQPTTTTKGAHLKEKILKINYPTCWGSTFKMLKRMIKLHAAITSYLTAHQKI